MASGGYGGSDDGSDDRNDDGSDDGNDDGNDEKVLCYAANSDEWEEMESLQNKSKYLFTASSNFFD